MSKQEIKDFIRNVVGWLKKVFRSFNLLFFNKLKKSFLKVKITHNNYYNGFMQSFFAYFKLFQRQVLYENFKTPQLSH